MEEHGTCSLRPPILCLLLIPYDIPPPELESEMLSYQTPINIPTLIRRERKLHSPEEAATLLQSCYSILSAPLDLSIHYKKRGKVAELITPPIQEEPEPVSNVLQGDDILALAIKQEDLRKQHLPRPPIFQGKCVTQQYFIRKHKITKVKKIARHLVAHPATPEAITKPLDYSGPAEKSSDGKEQILPHNILGSLSEFKRIAIDRGNTELAEMIPDTICMVIPILEKPKKEPPKEKVNLWQPPSQHKSLKNWKRNMTLRQKQQEALSEHLKKPVSELLMNSADNYRRVQEERTLIERSLAALLEGKDSKVVCEFWTQPAYIGDEITGLVTQWQHSFQETVTHVGKPQSVQMESGLPSLREPWYRFTWEKSLFLIGRRKELQCILKDLDFNQPDIEGLEVVGKGQPFSSVSAQHFPILIEAKESTSKDVTPNPLADFPDVVPMPFLGPSLLFCGKPACWIDSSLLPDEKQIGIAVRLTFETMEGERTSSILTVVNNGTAAIWFDWRRLQEPDTFEEFKGIKAQRFYFNTKEGVILPGETKEYTFFFKSLNAGIFRECWEFGTHPTLLGGAMLQVTLRGVALSQDIFMEERKLLKEKLATQEATSIVRELLDELLRGIWSPDRAISPVDAYLTEEDLFNYRNPQLHYQHQVVRDLQDLWDEYIVSCPPVLIEEEEAVPPAPPVEEEQKLPVGPEMTTTPGEKSDILKVTEFQGDLEEGGPEKPEAVAKAPKWNLCVDDLKKAVMELPKEEKREEALSRLNKGARELCLMSRPLQSDLLYQMCFQLWRDAIDGLVTQALWLKNLMGIPEKDSVYTDSLEGQVEGKASGRVAREERKPMIQEKKQIPVKEKEEKKGGVKSPGKEDRTNSKKHKGREERRLQKSPSKEWKERSSSDELPPDQEPFASESMVDPRIQEKYNQRLYIEVYGLLDSLVTDMMLLFDELKNSQATEEESLDPIEPPSFST
ncbi:MYCBP-associated protein [Gracilinanus agilis]|uniref:MYCBP-associated protein n=1 Tax=Gracilinanus agilis TaxID=191870 RepID=UPI001CFD1556|nr:MYCBP-associated protein [Gracilinanus agilis]